MGNCTSGTKKKRKGDSADDKSGTENKPNEDVTYASIDHSSIQGSRRTRETTDDECDYAIVNIPAEPVSECSSKEECSDDYVLMG
ncbi:uncharacterized protein si:ch211-214p13.7 [Thunnus maccoyii]|uniref:uncharacterized protein si:ch211-214p13.7 n=1 Tax=Thunnus maccoyii TaxID=8240 RepID=UPI001C4D5B7C|nr:uncharacterized protein si:ch211-214p13.7 [Thunnus maccoyii]